MKKIFITLAAVVMTAFAAMAQDMSAATETYNNGASFLSNGDFEGALSSFKSAMTMAEACGEEGADILANCKSIIPQILFQQGKELIKAEDYDGAIAKLQETIATAKEYGNEETALEASELVPQIKMQKAGSLLNSKNFAEAAAAYEEVLAGDPANGTAALRLGMAYGQIGKVAEAEKAYLNAAANGQDKAAYKQLSSLFVKAAAGDLKAKKYESAIEKALKSNEYLENPTALKVAGTAASQLKKNEDAINYLTKYLELSPNAKDASQMAYTIAATAQSIGKKDVAVEYYSKILADPKYGEVAKAQIAALKK